MHWPMRNGAKVNERNRPGREMPRRRVPGQSWEGKAAWRGGGVAEPERGRNAPTYGALRGKGPGGGQHFLRRAWGRAGAGAHGLGPLLNR